MSEESQPPASECAVPSDSLTQPVAELPRIWPCLFASIAILPVALIVSTLAVLFALACEGSLTFDEREASHWVEQAVRSPLGLLIVFLPGELTFLAGALGPAVLSPMPAAQRLGLWKSGLTRSSIALVLLATLGVQFLILVGIEPWFGEPSEHLKWLERVISQPTGLQAVFTLLCLSAVPALCEELFFRGYVQTRLSERWSAARAIGWTSTVFAIAHGDPQHAIAVLPLGLWLGYVAWKSSVGISILCHFANNSVAILSSWWLGDPDQHELRVAVPLVVVAVASLVCLLVALVVLRRIPPRRSSGRMQSV